MKRIDVALIYEHVARELDAVCAVTALARRKFGITVEIVQWPFGVYRDLGRYRPRVVVLPFCYSEEQYYSLLLDWRKAAFATLSWEQFFYPGNAKAKSPRGPFACQYVFHHAWSDLYVAFLESCGVPRDHIRLNGQPVYALYSEPYRRYFESRESLARKYGLDPGRRWIFFPENYNWAFYSEGFLETFAAEAGHETVRAMRDFCRRSLKETLAWCHEAGRSDDVEIILRPRPLTPLAQFREAAEWILPDLPRGLHFIQDETVREWTLAGDAVVSSHSTSLVEAAVAGKPAYMLEPVAIPPSLHAVWHEHAARIRTPEEFRDLCRRPLSPAVSSRLGDWARRTCLAHGDPLANAAEWLNELVRGRRSLPAPPRRVVTQPGRRKLPAWLMYEYRRIWLRKYRHRVTLPADTGHTRDLLSRDELEARIDRWSAILD